jgi:putative addiction module killer protein
MIEIRRTEIFRDWLINLRDGVAQARIAKQIDRLALGNPGQSRGVGEGIVELKIDFGPGYRVYYVAKGSVLIVLLCGGDKSTQTRTSGEQSRSRRRSNWRTERNGDQDVPVGCGRVSDNG